MKLANSEIGKPYRLIRILKVVSILIATFGLAFVAFGVVLLSAVDRNTRLLEAMQQQGMAQDIDAQGLRSIIIRHATGYVVIGLLSLVSGIGIFFRRKWSRFLWLAIIAFILGISGYQFVTRMWHGIVDKGDVIGFTVILLIFGATGIYFLRPKTRLFFENREIT